MPAIRLTAFSGIRPKIKPRLLAETEAQIARNCKAYSGELVPFRDGSLVFTHTLTSLASIVRLVRQSQEIWLGFARPTSVALGPVAKNIDRRFYYTCRPPEGGDTFTQHEPRVSDYLAASSGGGTGMPNGWNVLGVPKPVTAPTVGTSGGSSAITVSRSYAYTFVEQTTFSDGSTFEEEGPPSPPTVASGLQDATWNLSNMETAPPNSGTVTDVAASTPTAGFTTVTLDTVRYLRVGETMRFASMPANSLANNVEYRIAGVDPGTDTVWFQVTTTATASATGTWTREAPHRLGGMKKRVYRTDVNGVYRFIADVDIATTTYADTTLDTALVTAMVSANYYQPPTDLHSLIALPNGSLAGISGNQLCFSEPYQPHAWPPQYRKTANVQGKALGNIGTTVVMVTEAKHYVAAGADPSTVVMEEAQGTTYPCVAPRGVASLPYGVVWPTQDGLAVHGGGAAALLTEQTFKRDEWQLLKPATIVAAEHDGRYLMSYRSEGAPAPEILIIDRNEAAFAVQSDVQAEAMYSDPFDRQMYYSVQGRIYSWDTNESVRRNLDWKSKEFVFPSPINMGAALVEADFALSVEESAALEAARDAIAAANLTMLAGTGWIGGEVNELEVNGIELNESPLTSVPAITYDSLIFELYASGVLKFAKTITRSVAFSMPRGYKSDVYSVRVTGNVGVKAIVLGTNHEALKNA